MVTKQIIVKTQFEALHYWDTIPENHPTWFLRNPHRHIFHIELRFVVHSSDREKEFIDYKHQVDTFLKAYFSQDEKSGIRNIGSRSCEHLAELLLTQFCATWVQVLEDNEMGAIVEWKEQNA